MGRAHIGVGSGLRCWVRQACKEGICQYHNFFFASKLEANQGSGDLDADWKIPPR